MVLGTILSVVSTELKEVGSFVLKNSDWGGIKVQRKNMFMVLRGDGEGMVSRLAL